MTYHGNIDRQGRLYIPSELRDQLALLPGMSVSLSIRGGVLTVQDRRAERQAARRFITPWQEGAPLESEALIAERRDEARRE